MITATVAGQLTKSIQFIKPIPPASAQGFVGELYRQMQTDFMAGPVLTLHSPAPEVMAGVWSILRETLLVGGVDRASKEAVAATVSKLNECPFCVDAHTSLLHATGDHDVVRAILRGDITGIRNSHVRSLVQWVLASRAVPTTELSTPPFSPIAAPEILGTAFTFHYINRMVNLFLRESLLPLPPALMGVTRRLMGATVGRRMVRSLTAGRSLKFVPQAQLPYEFSWALPNQTVTHALAGFARVVAEGGRASLSEPVRRLVQEHVRAWQGQSMGISRRWVEDAVVDLEARDQAAARLALLTALASYQVDASIIADFQSYEPDDAQLIRATAWASFTAAQRAISWVAAPSVAEA